jgi:hypothetical protein
MSSPTWGSAPAGQDSSREELSSQRHGASQGSVRGGVVPDAALAQQGVPSHQLAQTALLNSLVPLATEEADVRSLNASTAFTAPAPMIVG